jgi:predicted metal-dependent hydrolase
MDAHLRAGIAIYNAGYYHAAHDAWEDHWLALDAGTEDERFLHGLIQFTAAVHHAQQANWNGMQGLAESGTGYLEGLPTPYRAVDIGAIRDYLGELARDPEHVERAAPPAVTLDGRALDLDDLEYPALRVAGPVLAEELEPYDEAMIERAVDFADEVVAARDAGESQGDDRFLTLITDFVRDAEHRPLIYQRLEGHVDRRVAEFEDVEGLFD